MLAMHPFDASVDLAAQQAYARLVATLGGGENAQMEVRSSTKRRASVVFFNRPFSPPPQPQRATGLARLDFRKTHAAAQKLSSTQTQTTTSRASRSSRQSSSARRAQR